MSETLEKYGTTAMQLPPEVLASVVLNGDVSKLDAKQKIQYYVELCNRVGIDPATQPFKLLKLNGKEIFYADKGATQQLSQLHKISHEIVKRERVEDVYIVTVRAKLEDGRYTDEDGAVKIGGMSGDNLANALMKATTKAKRRSVLALTGLGMLDESEIETIPNAQTIELPKADTPAIKDVVEKPKEEKKEKRSDWYYSFRDSFESAKTMEEINSTIENIKPHRDEMAKDEISDLLKHHAKAVKRIGKESK